MIRQREVKTKHNTPPPHHHHVPPKSKTLRQKGDRLRRRCVSSTCSVYTMLSMLKLMGLLVCTALMSSVLLCTDQGSPSGHFFALEHTCRTLAGS